ncbi:unnamed protein product [Brassica rapa]|uniref:RING-type domain-containing protein n=1 Tax=Brassica campestris TaxID=3711 RepID=A0A3P6BIP8_BRACM|nr:unnamed protein product [Brassica rapa]VDD02728.1 unnamed protein product [Brassica rapa]
MRCNACWRELEGRAISTTCGHLLCTEDANKILSNDGACPICEQVLSKSLMKPVDISPNEEWINMVMAGISPQIPSTNLILFSLIERDLGMQCKMYRVVAQCCEKCEGILSMFSEKMEQVRTAYQKMGKSCQMMEQEIENLTKYKQELQEKFSEKSRSKRKLDEMYDQLRSEYESVKRTAIQPANNFYPRHQEPDLFSYPRANMMENREPTRKDRSFYSPGTPGPRDEIWPARPNSSNSGPFDITNDSPTVPADLGNRRAGGGSSNPQSTLRNLILSPIKRSKLSRSCPQLFT